jgi:hypothetical protein
MSQPIRRIQNDLRTLQTAKATQQKAGTAVRQDEHELTRDRDAFVSQQKQLVALRAEPLADPTQTAALTQQVQTTHAAVLADKSDVTRDQHSETAAAGRVKTDTRRALKDLRPAENQMSLKATNATRKELGLTPVHHLLRAAVPNVVGGETGRWIAEAQTVLKEHGVPLSKMNARDINTIIEHESSGNPDAINRWDSNAAAGHPSEGLMQTIAPTFNEFKLRGHGQILNPVDNIIAGVRYALSRYGSISNVPGVKAVHAGDAYVGY